MPRCMIRAAVSLLLASVAMPALAQNWASVQALSAGTEVRVATSSGTTSGRIDHVADSALVLAAGKSQSAFDKKDVRAGSVRKPGHRTRNALIGLAVGAGVGLAVGLASRAKPNQIQVVSGGTVTAVGTGAGA